MIRIGMMKKKKNMLLDNKFMRMLLKQGVVELQEMDDKHWLM